MYTYGTVNSIFVEIQPDSTNIKNDPRTVLVYPHELEMLSLYHFYSRKTRLSQCHYEEYSDLSESILQVLKTKLQAPVVYLCESQRWGNRNL